MNFGEELNRFLHFLGIVFFQKISTLTNRMPSDKVKFEKNTSALSEKGNEIV